MENKEGLVTDIFYELDMINFICRLCKSAVHYNPEIELQLYDVVFWDMRKRSGRISGMVEKLADFNKMVENKQSPQQAGQQP